MANFAGDLASAGIYGRSLHPLHLVFSAWVLFVLTMFVHLLVMVSLRRRYGIGEPRLTHKPDLAEHVPLPLQPGMLDVTHTNKVGR